MVSITAGTLVKLWQSGHQQVRAFVFLLAASTVIVNLFLFVMPYTGRWMAAITLLWLSRDVAKVMHHLKGRKLRDMLLEMRFWNFYALPIFINNIDRIVNDRTLINDAIRTFDNPSSLLGPREDVLAELKAKGVCFVAVHSPAVHSHIQQWGLERLAQVDSYTIYRIPRTR